MISVVLCTHNPLLPRLHRVLAALRRQSLALAAWELLVIDNASVPPLAPRLDLSWHPQARILVEPQLGLTSARLCGIAEADGDLIVFVDDDNILATDYLKEAGRIAENWPMLGAWGGRIDPEFAVPPPEWTRPFWPLLAIEPVERPRWSNAGLDSHAVPPGAGQCVRAAVARRYADLLASDPLRRSLDRIGESLSSCGDRDLALTAVDLGLGTGQFPSLRLTHVIPASRLDLTYLLRLVEEVTYSTYLLNHLRGRPATAGPSSRLRAWLEKWHSRQMSAQDRAFDQARKRALERACARLESSEWRSASDTAQSPSMTSLQTDHGRSGIPE